MRQAFNEQHNLLQLQKEFKGSAYSSCRGFIYNLIGIYYNNKNQEKTTVSPLAQYH